MTLKIVLLPSSEGGYMAYAPSLPGCISEGDTPDEALVNIREAIELYLEGGEEEGALAEGAVVWEMVV
jgi:predicted RNase H-like HicB family nuclease